MHASVLCTLYHEIELLNKCFQNFQLLFTLINTGMIKDKIDIIITVVFKQARHEEVLKSFSRSYILVGFCIYILFLMVQGKVIFDILNIALFG